MTLTGVAEETPLSKSLFFWKNLVGDGSTVPVTMLNIIVKLFFATLSIRMGFIILWALVCLSVSWLVSISQ